nr:hypothetical protein [Cryobacterium sp. TMS1-13-1]
MDEFLQSEEHTLRVKHDVLVEHSERQVVERGQQTVAGSIANVFFPGLVVTLTVRLDDHTTLDEHIDAADPIDVHLNITAVPGGAEQIAHDGFLAGIYSRVDPSPQIAVDLGDGGKNLTEVGRFDLVLVQGRVERRQSETWFLAPDDLGDGIARSDAVFCTVARIDEWPPVQLDAIPRGRREGNLPTVGTAQTRSLARNMHVRELRIESEEANLTCCRDAGFAATHSYGLECVTVRSRKSVMIAANSDYRIAAHGCRDVFRSHPAAQ